MFGSQYGTTRFFLNATTSSSEAILGFVGLGFLYEKPSLDNNFGRLLLQY